MIWTTIWQTDWFGWGLALIIGMPLLVIIFGELIYHSQKREKDFAQQLQVIRNVLLPLFAVYLLCINVLSYSSESLSIKIMETIIWVIVFNIIFASVNLFLFTKASKNSWRSKVPKLLLDLIRVVLVAIGTAVVLSSVWNADLGKVITALGVGSIVIGLALQDTLSNIISGIALLFEQPFRIGDWVKIGEHEGKVMEMNWRAIRLLTKKQKMIIVPNVILAQGVFHNYSQPSMVYQHRLYIGFSYDDPPNKIKGILNKTIKETPQICQHISPIIRTHAYDDSQITYEIEFAIEDYGQLANINDHFMTRIWYVANRMQVNIPFPVREIHHYDKNTGTSSWDTKDWAKMLRQLSPLMTLTQEEIELLSQHVRIQRFGKNEIVLETAKAIPAIFIILKGEIILHITKNNTAPVIIATLAEGELFGENVLFSYAHSRFTAQVTKDASLLSIPPDVFKQLVQQNPSLASAIDHTSYVHQQNMLMALNKAGQQELKPVVL